MGLVGTDLGADAEGVVGLGGDAPLTDIGGDVDACGVVMGRCPAGPAGLLGLGVGTDAEAIVTPATGGPLVGVDADACMALLGSCPAPTTDPTDPTDPTVPAAPGAEGGDDELAGALPLLVSRGSIPGGSNAGASSLPVAGSPADALPTASSLPVTGSALATAGLGLVALGGLVLEMRRRHRPAA